MFIEGKLVNTVITQSDNNFSLKGMICPTFQNDGEASVLFDGVNIAPGESYAVGAQNVILTNTVSVLFENDPDKSKILRIGYVQTSVEVKTQDTI